MASDENKRDLTANVPDELLCQLFENVSSLPDKFSLAAVNKRFRRCIKTLLRKPMDLNIDFQSATMNGYKIKIHKWSMAVKVLAQKTQFERIKILDESSVPAASPYLEEVLSSILSSANYCLSELKVLDMFLNQYCSYLLLERFVSKCHKLSIFRLALRQWLTPNLVSALDNKTLTELKLDLEDLSDFSLFDSIKLNSIQKLCLSFYSPSFNTLDLMRHLASRTDWDALEELHFTHHIDPMEPDLGQLFPLVAQLPVLRHFSVYFPRTSVGLSESVTAITSALLTNRRRPKTLTIEYSTVTYGTGCQSLQFLQQVMNLLPDVLIQIDSHKLSIASGNISFLIPLVNQQCYGPAAECVQCHSFYINVLKALTSKAEDKSTGHLEAYRLDRCRVDRVVDHLNELTADWCKAIHSEINDAKDTATLIFDVAGGDSMILTVACDSCFNPDCLGCMI